MRRFATAGRILTSLALLATFAAMPVAARAQEQQYNPSAQPTREDIQRLQDTVYDVWTDVSRVRPVDAARADDLQLRLDALREEVTYLKVKLRKEGVTRAEYSRLRDQLDDLRVDARSALAEPARGGVTGGTMGGRPTAAADRPEEQARPTRQGTSARPDEVPVGTEIDVRLESALNSGTAQVEDRFTATTIADLYNGDQVLIPAGSTARGVVTSVTRAGRIERTGKLTLSFDRVTVKGRSYPIHATVTEALQSGGYRQDAGKIGAGAGVGAIIGGIIGGLKGALAGILIGGGGVIAGTEGQEVNLPIGTVLRIQFEAPLTVK